MSNKIETWITRFVVVAYGLACLLAAIYESNSKKCDMEKCEKTELVSTEDTNMKQPMCLWLAEKDCGKQLLVLVKWRTGSGSRSIRMSSRQRSSSAVSRLAIISSAMSCLRLRYS